MFCCGVFLVPLCFSKFSSQLLHVSHVLLSVDIDNALDGFRAVGQCLHGMFMRCHAWMCDVFVLELHRVAETVASCVLDVKLVCVIMF